MVEMTKNLKKQKSIENAKIYGLFNKMIEDIPISKREKHEADMAQLEALGIIEPFDFRG